MSATQTSSMQAEPTRHQGSTPDNETKEGTRPPDPEGPPIFKHSPKPETDPWEILLTPELEADTGRCSAWKDEVPNLLIFAGLFSAVVTAFLIESYKLLQPDPNDAVVGLLFHIATGLNNSSPFPPSVDPTSITTPFSQTPSSIRLNILWFISLVLSLTSVLVGTICLQWLREHQSYTGFSAKERLAILHMRSEALEVWYIPQIFSVLPVLLQGAVALFLAGLIDFVLPLGRELTFAISVSVGVPLLFLSMTTVLPTCQGFLFLTGIYPYSKPPAPCAFKSPQSRVVLAVFAPLLRLLSYIISRIYQFKHSPPSLFRRYEILAYLTEILQQQPWATLDTKWLALRDAYHQRIVDKDARFLFDQYLWKDCFPLSDVTQCLVKITTEKHTAKHTDVFLGAAVYCFQDISASIWTDHQDYQFFHYGRRERRNNYFEQLYLQPSDCSMAKYLLHGGAYQDRPNDSLKFSEFVKLTTPYLFHHDQVLSFLVKLLKIHNSPALHRYQVELWTEVISKSHNLAPLALIVGDSSSVPLPFLLASTTVQSICDNPSESYEGYLAASDILSVIFKSAVSHRISRIQLTNSLFTHTDISWMLGNLAGKCVDYYQVANSTSKIFNQENKWDIGDQYISVFKFVANHLNEERTNSTSESQEDMTGLLFYLASIFMMRVVLHQTIFWELPFDKESSSGKEFASLFEALLQYRSWIETTPPDRSECDTDRPRYFFTAKLSDWWWDDLIEKARKCGLKAAEQGLTLAEGSAPGDDPNTSSQAINLENTGGSVITQSSPSTSPLTIIHPLSDHIPVLRTHPKPALLIGTASRSNTGDKENRRHSPSGIPATADHTIDTSEGLDRVDSLPYPTSQPSAPRSDSTQAIGSQTAENIACQVLSPAQPTAPSGNTSVLDMTHDQAAEADSQPGEHVAIDVRVQAIPGQVELGTTGSSDEIVQERPMEEDSVISMLPGT